MVDSFVAQSDRFVVTKNSKVAFDTDAPSVQLIGSPILISGSINFPNLLSAPVYRQANTFPFSATACDSWSGLLPQEHGPGYGDFSPTATDYGSNGAPPRRELPSQLIGFVPPGTDYIDVRAKLVRTITPPAFRNIAPPIMFFPQNQWINLPGGSCQTEFYFPLMRMFEIVLSGTSLILNRYQSVNRGPQVTDTTGGDVNNTASTQIGAAWGNYANAPVYWAIPAVLYETKGPDASGNKRPPWGTTSSNSCFVGSVVDYTSQYDVDLSITPGVYRP